MAKKLRGWLGAAALSLALALGCATTVIVEQPRPGPGPLAGVKTLAVGDFSGPGGEVFRQALTQALQERGGFVLTSPAEAEVILSGEVEEEVSETRGEDLVLMQKETGQKERVTEKDPFVKKEFTVERPVYKEVVVPKPYVARSARVRVTYRLRGRVGEAVQAPGTVVKQFTRKYGGIEESAPGGLKLEDLPAREETLQKLLGRAAQKTAAELVPRPARLRLVLDEGRGIFGEASIKAGVEYAEKGEWDRAVQVWERVLAEEDPEHPSAHYNLGVAFERLGGLDNLKKAKEMYSRAALEGNKPLYREALTRVTVALREMEER